ncbi:MAG TPA: D-alanyl-D-alanine carboxypeptidase/D-alanyl-D-alanine-endopeptidase [Candidatus Baltobacteraceae bacterium]|nr:D-alanyl-D-alanine carboxypeptidase/D-alanyl-D-alanine-endopeptidase [Candidatus Baltobacteraceae bacterium]
MLSLLALLLPSPLFEAPTLRGALVSAYVISAKNGAVIFSRDPDAAVMPASTLKLVVGSAALDELGVDFRFTTQLATDGTSLFLVGGGDPLLRSSDLDQGAQAVATAGTTHFDALVGDDGALDAPRYPGGWEIDDLPYYYAAPPSPLSIDENSLHVALHPGAPGAPPTISTEPATNAITIVNEATTGPPHSDDTTALHVSWTAPDTLVLTGSLPADETDADIDASMLDPAAVTLGLAADALARAGITFANAPHLGMAAPAAHDLWVHRSPPLPDLLKAMWPPSNNLLAESLLDALGATRAAALDRERAWLRSIGVDPATTTLVDGSGLSAYDRISARDLVTVLAHDWNGPNRAAVLAALPVGGKSGTLAHRFTAPPLAGAVIAKTGTVNHTRTLAGYLLTPHGTLIFALMINDWMDQDPGAADRLHAFQSTFLESFFE